MKTETGVPLTARLRRTVAAAGCRRAASPAGGAGAPDGPYDEDGVSEVVLLGSAETRVLARPGFATTASRAGPYDLLQASFITRDLLLRVGIMFEAEVPGLDLAIDLWPGFVPCSTRTAYR